MNHKHRWLWWTCVKSGTITCTLVAELVHKFIYISFYLERSILLPSALLHIQGAGGEQDICFNMRQPLCWEYARSTLTTWRFTSGGALTWPL